MNRVGPKLIVAVGLAILAMACVTYALGGCESLGNLSPNRHPPALVRVVSPADAPPTAKGSDATIPTPSPTIGANTPMALTPTPTPASDVKPWAELTPVEKAIATTEGVRQIVVQVQPVADAAGPITGGTAPLTTLLVTNALTALIAGLKTYQSKQRGYALQNIDADHPEGAVAATNDPKAKAIIASTLQ